MADDVEGDLGEPLLAEEAVEGDAGSDGGEDGPAPVRRRRRALTFGPVAVFLIIATAADGWPKMAGARCGVCAPALLWRSVAARWALLDRRSAWILAYTRAGFSSNRRDALGACGGCGWGAERR